MIHHGALREEYVAHALENAASRRILAQCIDHPRSVRDISEDAGLPLASAYRQVKWLAEHGILIVERSAMTTDGKPYDLYRSRVRAARIEILPGAVTVTWEINHSIEDRLHSMWEMLGG